MFFYSIFKVHNSTPIIYIKFIIVLNENMIVRHNIMISIVKVASRAIIKKFPLPKYATFIIRMADNIKTRKIR